jgi:tRNA (guanine-N7-)-methyltransferase
MRKGKQKALQEILPQVQIILPEDGTIALEELFDFSPQELWLEIGCGGGEHLIAQAQEHPNVGILGCDLFINGMAKIVQAIAAQNLNNIRLVVEDARLLMPKIPSSSITKIFILFPDPWPKKRHHKRRLIQAEFLEELARVLTPNGNVIVATDDPDYLTWIQEAFQNAPQFQLDLMNRKSIFERPSSWPHTRYEQKAIAAGRTPGYLVYKIKI